MSLDSAEKVGLEKWRLSYEYPLRAEAVTAVDMLNSLIGLARAHIDNSELDALLARFQRELFVVGAEVAEPIIQSDKDKLPRVTVEMVRRLELHEEELLKRSKLGHRFVLPTGCVESSYLHVARAAGKAAQVKLIQLAKEGSLKNHLIIDYVNELSYLLYLWARLVNQRKNIAEEEWSGSNTA